MRKWLIVIGILLGIILIIGFISISSILGSHDVLMQNSIALAEDCACVL